MSRLRIKQTGQQPSKDPNPIWRGVGCVSMFVLTLGSYILSGPVIAFINTQGWLPFRIPNTMTTLVDNYFPRPLAKFPFNECCIDLPAGWAFRMDGFEFSQVRFMLGVWPLQVVFAIFVGLLLFAIMTMIWGIINPPKLGPQDAPPIHRKIDKSKVR